MGNQKTVKIKTAFWGEYIVKIIDVRYGFRGYAKVTVEIVEVVSEALQCSIIFPLHSYKRKSYVSSQIVEFNLNEIEEVNK